MDMGTGFLILLFAALAFVGGRAYLKKKKGGGPHGHSQPGPVRGGGTGGGKGTSQPQ